MACRSRCSVTLCGQLGCKKKTSASEPAATKFEHLHGHLLEQTF
jgi:hypothetical protein